jgi:hypothetical protein
MMLWWFVTTSSTTGIQPIYVVKTLGGKPTLVTKGPTG